MRRRTRCRELITDALSRRSLAAQMQSVRIAAAACVLFLFHTPVASFLGPFVYYQLPHATDRLCLAASHDCLVVNLVAVPTCLFPSPCLPATLRSAWAPPLGLECMQASSFSSPSMR